MNADKIKHIVIFGDQNAERIHNIKTGKINMKGWLP